MAQLVQYEEDNWLDTQYGWVRFFALVWLTFSYLAFHYKNFFQKNYNYSNKVFYKLELNTTNVKQHDLKCKLGTTYITKV